MASFIKRTASNLRQPLVCFGALAASCLISGQLTADENDKPSAQETKLERLFAPETIQFSPVPPMQESTLNSLVPLRQIVEQTKPTVPPANPAFRGPSASELMGVIKQSSIQTPEETKARMVMPAEIVAPASMQQHEKQRVVQRPAPQQAQFNSLPAGRLGSVKDVESRINGSLSDYGSAYSAAQVSWQEPGYDETPSFQQMPLNQGPAARVARAVPATVAPKVRTGVHRLSNVNIQRFESAVVATWGNRLATSTSQDGRYVRVEMPTRVPERMAMMIDRETETLSYEGDDSLRENWHQLMEQMDSAPQRLADGRVVQKVLVDPNRAELKTIQQAAFLMGLSQDITQPAQDITKPGQDESITLPPGTSLPQGLQQVQGVKDTVKIVQDPDTGAITLVGSPEDIAVVSKIIAEISAASKGKQAQVKRIPLVNLQSEAIAEQLQEIYDASYESSSGAAKIEPLASPNALVVVGQPAGIKAVEDMVAAMDVEGGELEQGAFKTFQLKHLSAVDAKSRLDTFFNQANRTEGTQLPSPPVTVVADFRSNSITVKGAKQFIDQAEQYLKTIDVVEVDGKTHIVKIFPLRNTLAEEMAIVLQDAITGQQPNAGQGYNPNQQAQQAQQNQNQQIQPTNSSLGAQQLSLKMIGDDGREVKSGIMFDVRVTVDKNSNSLVVTGPAESMDLIATLIKQLDRIPDAQTQIKVFEIVNGDAESLLSMLEALFGADDTQQAGATGTSNLSQLPLQKLSSSDGQTLINLRFSFDTRTNTIIASGPAGDLQVVEDLLNRLDAEDVTDRKPRVYRLSNAPALDVVDAINSYLEPRNDVVADDPRTIGAYIQADRSVIVVAETVSNSVIVSATPAQREEIEELIRGLDRRPQMVKIKVMIAQVDLGSAEEFGVDIGVQDSLLFDRGTSIGAGNAITGIGFPFPGTPGSSNANANAVFPGTLAGQALSTLGVGTINNTLGYGGLILSASNESVDILIRALKDKAAIRILSRPHISTVENLQGRVTIGESVARVSSVTQNTLGGQPTQNIDFVDVGVTLEVTPRVSPDGMIVMAVSIIKSELGDEAEGVTIGFSEGANPQPIKSANIRETKAETTLMARSGQTVVFSGLIEERKVHRKRGAPIISDLPWIGPLFSFEQDLAERKELLIIMTPYLIDDEHDINTQNQDEMERMHWCLCDVAEVYGNTDYHGFQGNEPGIETIYPDADPSGLRGDPLFKSINKATPPVPTQPRFETEIPQTQTRPMSRSENEVQQATRSTGARRN